MSISLRHGSTIMFACATLLLLLSGHGARAEAGASPPTVALPPFPGVADAIVQIDRIPAPGVTTLQRRLMLFEGALAVGHLPCTGEIRSDASRGVTIGCVQYGLRGRLQPVLLAMDRASPDQFAAAFGANVEAVRAMLRLPTIAAQVAWARSITDMDGSLVGAWRQEFATLAAMPEFQAAYIGSTTIRYRRAAAWAETYGFRSRRGLALMFDLALFHGLSNEQKAVLAKAMNAADLRGSGEMVELRRLQAFADTLADMDADPLLRFHLTTIAEGRALFLGYALDLAEFGITLDPVMPGDVP